VTSPELPEINIDLGGEDFVGTPLNLELFTFAPWATLDSGEWVANPESFNHVFAQSSTDGETATGAYILDPDKVKQLGAIMLHNGFPARLNQTVIPKCDEDAHTRFVDQNIAYETDDLDDFLPEGWGGN
jgi:hypothetical protein